MEDVDHVVESEEPTFYEKVGGRPTFVALVRAFFQEVRQDPEIFDMYNTDIVGSERRLVWFLEQYWGGPDNYSKRRGAPLLKMRHMPFKITPDVRDRWMAHMHAAIDKAGLAEDDAEELREYMERAATYLINAD